MFTPLRLLPRAIRLWWREFAFLMLLNFIWLVCQLTIVLGGPATAALVYVARRVADRELVGLDDFWHGLRHNFTAGLKWSLAQILVYGVLAFNLWFYAGQSGLAVLSLRYAWTIMALIWFAINLYYWPLHFEQADRRFRTTLANATKMAFLNPNATIDLYVGRTGAYRLLRGHRRAPGLRARRLAEPVGRPDGPGQPGAGWRNRKNRRDPSWPRRRRS